MSDPVTLVAKQRIVRLSADIEVQLLNKSSVLVQVLMKARDEAADATVALVNVRYDQSDEIRNLQNTILRFDSLVRWLKDIVAKGFEYDREINDDEREELADMLAFVPDGGGALDADEALEAGTMERIPFDA